MNIKFLLAISFIAGMYMAFAGTYTIKANRLGDVDLTDSAIYEEGGVPDGADDTLVLHEEWIDKVGYQYLTVKDDASLALLSRIGKISIPYRTRLTVHCDADLTIAASITGVGTLVKDGSGELHLSSHSKSSSGSKYEDLNANYCVTNGTLSLPVADDQKPLFHYYGDFYVAEGAVLALVQNGTTQCQSLNGYGVVTNRSETAGCDEFIINQSYDQSRFHGIIGGRISVRVNNPYTVFSNPNSTYSGATDIRGYNSHKGAFETPMLGMVNQPSPLGTNKVVALNTGGGMLRYTGTVGETTDKLFNLLDSPSIIDAGAHGGIVFTGVWQPYSNCRNLIKVYLTGSNTVPCVVKGAVSSIQNDGFYHPYYITKQGTGTWRFEQTVHRSLGAAPQGVFAVEEGTLEFNTISNAGKYCALGYATALYRREADVPSEENAKVEYAWLLGGRDENGNPTEGRMCYTGTWPAQITNRPMALASSGAFATTQARIRLFDVRTEGEGAKMLALEAPAGIVNDLCDIAGSESAPVGIIKRGEGTWWIGGNVSLGGPISVEGGELVVENRPAGSAYTWFRLTVKQTAATCPRYPSFNSNDRYIRMGELGLFDKNGNRLALGIKQAESPFHVLPGMSQVAADTSNGLSFDKPLSNTSCLFDNLKPDAGGSYYGGMRAVSDVQIRLDNPNTWASVVLRLTNGSPEAVSFDYVNPGTTKNEISWGHSYPTAMRLEASNDGVNWEKVWEDDELEIPEGLETDDLSKTYYRWASNCDDWGTALKPRKHEDGKSFKLERTRQLRTASVLTTIPELSVAAGASLKVIGDEAVVMPEVRAIKVDGSAGAGTVQGVKFAASGVLNVVNCSFEGHSVSLPLGFAQAEGVENLSKWAIKIDGGEIPSRLNVSVASDGSSVTVSKIGMTIVVR
jgi:hypothetical protein